MVIDVKERNLVVFLPQDEEDCVEKVYDFDKIICVRIVENCEAGLGVVVPWCGNTKQVQVFRLIKCHQNLSRTSSVSNY